MIQPENNSSLEKCKSVAHRSPLLFLQSFFQLNNPEGFETEAMIDSCVIILRNNRQIVLQRHCLHYCQVTIPLLGTLHTLKNFSLALFLSKSNWGSATCSFLPQDSRAHDLKLDLLNITSSAAQGLTVLITLPYKSSLVTHSRIVPARTVIWKCLPDLTPREAREAQPI